MPNYATPVRAADYTTTSTTWDSWSSTASICITASTSATASATWLVWSGSISSSGIIVSDNSWPYWSSNAVLANNFPPHRVQQIVQAMVPAETEEARIARVARETAAKIARERAIAKADALLVSILDEVQKQHLKETDSFMVLGKSGKLYRVRRGRSGNVDEVAPDGKIVQRYCAHPYEFVPDGDTMVAQKLMLECDEEAFLRMANRHGAPFGSKPVPLKMIERTLAARANPRLVIPAAA